jgi:hypothetical protein
MPKIKNLSDACKVSFSPDGPISEEALEKVRALLGESKLYTILNSRSYFLFGIAMVEGIYIIWLQSLYILHLLTFFFHLPTAIIVFYFLSNVLHPNWMIDHMLAQCNALLSNRILLNEVESVVAMIEKFCR